MARKPSSSGSPRSSSSRRKPVTIDLDAKKVEPAAGKKPAAAEAAKPESAAKPPQSPADGPTKCPAQEPAAKPAEAPAAASAAGKPAEPAAGKPAEPGTSKPAAPAAQAAPAAKSTHPAAAVPQPRQKSSPLPYAVAAIVGGAVSLAGAIGLDRLNVIDLFGGPQADAVAPEKIAGLESGLASLKTYAEGLGGELETQKTEFTALKAQSETSAGETIGALQARIDSLQDEIAGLSGSAAAPDLKPLQARLAELENLIGSGGNGREIALEALDTRLTSLGEKVEAQTEAASRIDPLDERLAALESSQTEAVAALDGKISTLESLAGDAAAKAAEASAKAEAAASSSAVEGAVEASALAARKAEQAVAIAPVLAAESLQRSIDAGQPFEAVLTAFANLGVEDPAIAVLQPYAANGLPTIAALKADYAALETSFEATPATEAPEETGSLDRLLKGAFSVVKVRPVEPQAGDDAAAIGSRIKGALADRDLNRALAEWESLPDERKAASQDWAGKVRAIVEANAFAEKVRAGALARLNVTQ